MLNLRLNYPSVKQEADIFRDFIAAMPEQERYSLLTPGPFAPDAATEQLLERWLQLAPGAIQQHSEVITTCSGNSGLHCILTVLKPGVEAAAIESFTYGSFKQSGKDQGYHLEPIECDDEGMVPGALEQYLKAGQAKLVYLQPTLHNPTCSVMSLKRREEIVAVVRSFPGVYVIEDDAYRFLHPSPPPYLLQLMPERTIHICSFSKMFNPIVRAAYVIHPKGLLPGMENVIRFVSSGSSAVFSAFTRYLMQGEVQQQIIAEKRSIAVRLHQKITQLFRGLDYKTYPGSYHIWLKMPAGTKASAFVAAMRARQIDIMSSADFSVNGNEAFVRIAMGSVWHSPELEPALEAIATAVKERAAIA